MLTTSVLPLTYSMYCGEPASCCKLSRTRKNRCFQSLVFSKHGPWKEEGVCQYNMFFLHLSPLTPKTQAAHSFQTCMHTLLSPVSLRAECSKVLVIFLSAWNPQSLCPSLTSLYSFILCCSGLLGSLLSGCLLFRCYF